MAAAQNVGLAAAARFFDKEPQGARVAIGGVATSVREQSARTSAGAELNVYSLLLRVYGGVPGPGVRGRDRREGDNCRSKKRRSNKT